MRGGRVFGPTGAAVKWGMPRSTLESKVRALKIDKNRFKPSPGTWPFSCELRCPSRVSVRKNSAQGQVFDAARVRSAA